MNKKERDEVKEELVEICRELGCSGKNPELCPGDPKCKLIRKLFEGNVNVKNKLVLFPVQPQLF